VGKIQDPVQPTPCPVQTKTKRVLGAPKDGCRLDLGKFLPVKELDHLTLLGGEPEDGCGDFGYS
jgi:hypothetical protein